MAKYYFITRWRFNAPVEIIWNEIVKPEQWPQWWRGVMSVEKTKTGNINNVGTTYLQTLKSFLPYKLKFSATVDHVEEHKRIISLAKGELQGSGLWIFESNGIQTTVSYFWSVETTGWWMNFLAPAFRSIFTWNHNLVMKWGGDGLARRLHCSVQHLCN